MMEDYYYTPMKMKRKDLDEVNDDFSDFSLSSPARKIRRLDAELPPIIEEEEMEIPIIEQPIPEQKSFENNVVAVGRGASRGVVIEELPSEPENVERAIVPFKPINSPLLLSPSNFSVTVNPQLLSGIKYQVLWSNQLHPLGPTDDGRTEREKSSGATNDCTAVIPWMPSQVPSAAGAEVSSQTEHLDMMDDEEMETTSMDVEGINVVFEQTSANDTGMTNLTDGLHQWQQQHCVIPQLPHNTSTPIVWYQ